MNNCPFMSRSVTIRDRIPHARRVWMLVGNLAILALDQMKELPESALLLAKEIAESQTEYASVKE